VFDGLQLALDAGWATGFLLGMIRVAAFVVVSPLLGRAMPAQGRMVLVVALGLFLAAPVPGATDLGVLLVAGFANAVVGAVLGFLTGLIFQLFPVAGSLIDTMSGLSVAQVFDPSQGEQAAVFARLFNLTALTIFFAIGGLHLVVEGLALSVQAIPLNGALNPQTGLPTLVLELTAQLMVAGLELAMPVIAALFLAEVVLGLAARLAPQANVFLLGLPAKIFIALSLVSVSLLIYPEIIDGAMAITRGTFVDALRGLGATAA
jgi:flagellar biosynthesis protein FliR